MVDTSDKEKLFVVATRTATETIKCILEEKKDVPASITNDQGQTLAHVAVKNDNLSIIKYVLEKDPSLLSKTDNDDYSVLHLAVERGALDIVKYLVEIHDANIIERNRRDLARTAVHTAVQFGHLNMLKYFVEERSVNVNMPGEWQDKPPVFLAVQYSHPDIFDYLVEERKADLTAVDFFGENILFIAAKVGNLSLIKRLLDDKKIVFELNQRNNNGETLVMTALKVNHTDVLKYLVDKKHADVNIPEEWDSTTLLHLAASRNDYKTCKYLIAHGAKMSFKDSSGQIPMEKATDEQLIEYMRNISEKMRSPRSVNSISYSSFQPVTLWSHSVTKNPLRELNHSGEDMGIFFDVVHSLQFKSLFNVIAESLMKNILKNRFLTLNFSSTLRTEYENIDPIAVDAISGSFDFEES